MSHNDAHQPTAQRSWVGAGAPVTQIAWRTITPNDTTGSVMV